MNGAQDPQPLVGDAVELDLLSVRGIEAVGFHGVYEHERREGQVFRVDLELALDTRAAAASDDLADTVDYGELVSRVDAQLRGEPVDLIETLAQRVADVCLTDVRVQRARVTVHKPEAPVAATFSDVTLTISRSRHPRGNA